MAPTSSSERAVFLRLLGLLTVLGALVRVLVAATEPPHFDESYTAVHYALGGLGDLLTTYDEPNNHLFHSLLAWASTEVLGDGPLPLRLPALLTGILLVPAIGFVARGAVARAVDAAVEVERMPRRATVAGLVAAGIVAAAPPLIAYSANARGYSPAMLLMAAQLLLCLRLSATTTGPRSRGRAIAWSAWIVCGALAIWTVPTAVVPVVAATIWLAALHWTTPRPRLALLPPAGALAASGLLALALYAPVLGQRGFSVDRFTAAPVRELATTLGHAWTAGLAAPLMAAAVLLALVGVARRPRLGPHASLALGLVALPVAVAVLGRALPYSRSYLFVLPILAVLAGVGAARITPWVARRGQAVAASVVAFGTLTALAALAGAQTRAAWGEDPPGPPQRDLIAALAASSAMSFGPNPRDDQGAPAHASSLQVAAPLFALPQAQYAFKTSRGAVPTAAEQALARTPDPELGGVVLARRDVSPSDALRALGWDPKEYVLRAVVRGDAQAIVLVRAGAR